MMIDTNTFQDRLKEAFVYDSTGIIGLVDRLLILACDEPLYADWDERLHVRYAKDKVESKQMRIGVFRAMLARIAVILHEQSSNEFSPYGDSGEIAITETCSSTLNVEFMNTPHEQWLRVWPKT